MKIKSANTNLEFKLSYRLKAYLIHGYLGYDNLPDYVITDERED